MNYIIKNYKTITKMRNNAETRNKHKQKASIRNEYGIIENNKETNNISRPHPHTNAYDLIST